MVSAILNIIGLAAAFAALYIILVQVRHDLTYNKALKDSDRIYCMMVGDQFADHGASSWICRPIAEAVIAASPDVEAGGCGYVGKNCPTAHIILEDNRQMSVKIGAFSEGGRDVFGLVRHLVQSRLRLERHPWHHAKGQGLPHRLDWLAVHGFHRADYLRDIRPRATPVHAQSRHGLRQGTTAHGDDHGENKLLGARNL